jgi:predicted dehydrogenase
MSVYNIGIIGYGGFGQFLHNSWEKLDNVRIVAAADAVASRDPGGDVAFYQTWQEMAADENVQIVSICTPPCSHAEIACGMMEAGKHVLVEKPMAINIDDGRRLVAVREKTGVAATIDYMIRFNPMMEALAKISKSGVLGKLRHFNLENYAQDEGLPAEHWFWDKDIAGGILIEHAVHFIDLCHSLTEQEYTSVTGLCHNRNEKQEDQVFAGAHYDGGLIATHYHSFARPGFFEETGIRLNYDLAQIDIHGWIPLGGKISAIVSDAGLKELEKLPGLNIHIKCGVDDIEDTSRPKGSQGTALRRKVNAGGIEYEVDHMIEASFGLKEHKQDVYADCVRAMMADLIMKIENPKHKLRVSLEDGLSSLEIACKATESGRSRT